MLAVCMNCARSSDLPLDFVGDFANKLGITDLTFVFGETNIPNFDDNFLNLSSIIRLKWINHSGPESFNDTINEIVGMQVTSSNSAIFFNGYDLQPVLMSLDSFNFFQKDITSMLDYDLSSVDLKWRLDFKVFFYETKSMEEIKLTEKYAIKGGQPIITDLGSWMKGFGFRSSNSPLNLKSLHRRRSDLMGVTLVNAAVEWPREVHFIRNASGSIIGSTGYTQEILQALQQDLNFTVVHITPADEKYGALENDNKTWNGLIGLLQRKEADIVTSPLATTQYRSQVVDFTYAVAHDKITLVAKRPSTSLPNIWVYVKMFSPAAWLCIGCFTTSLALLLAFFGLFDHSASSSIGLALSACYRMLLLISPDLTMKFVSSKMLFLNASIYAYLIFVIYAADLVSNMTIRSKGLEIGSFQDVLEQGYQVYVWHDAISHQILANAYPGSAMHDVYYKTMHNNNEAFYTGVEELTQILTKKPKSLVFGYANMISSFNEKDWQVLDILEMTWAYGSFAVQKDSEFTRILR